MVKNGQNNGFKKLTLRFHIMAAKTIDQSETSFD